MTSRPGFFNSGKTKASFQISGKRPDCDELLTIFVRTGRRSSHLLTSVDGMGSRGQDLRAEFWISCLTSRTDSIVKAGNDGRVSSKTADRVPSSDSDQSLFSHSESEREKWRKQWSPCRRPFPFFLARPSNSLPLLTPVPRRLPDNSSPC